MFVQNIHHNSSNNAPVDLLLHLEHLAGLQVALESTLDALQFLGRQLQSSGDRGLDLAPVSEHELRVGGGNLLDFPQPAILREHGQKVLSHIGVARLLAEQVLNRLHPHILGHGRILHELPENAVVIRSPHDALQLLLHRLQNIAPHGRHVQGRCILARHSIHGQRNLHIVLLRLRLTGTGGEAPPGDDLLGRHSSSGCRRRNRSRHQRRDLLAQHCSSSARPQHRSRVDGWPTEFDNSYHSNDRIRSDECSNRATLGFAWLAFLDPRYDSTRPLSNSLSSSSSPLPVALDRSD
ncbi:hypothetical protein Mapa_014180 [Marchantia paleacea]|nr:hypothetical protein Mapa_014180 [Marchantia paleacea]